MNNPFNNPFLIILALALMLMNCGKEEKIKLQSQIDSLKTELETCQQVAITLAQVGMLMDSIDANRQVLRINMTEGITFDSYTSRMVKDTEKKISDLENAIKKSKTNASYSTVILNNLKEDIEKKNQEIANIQVMVARLQTKNENLIKISERQSLEIFDLGEQLTANLQEITLLEARMKQLMKKSKLSDAEQYYSRGLAVETVAYRIKLAPRKKKETLKEALDFYKKSLSLGYEPAKAKIYELNKLLKE